MSQVAIDIHHPNATNKMLSRETQDALQQLDVCVKITKLLPLRKQSVVHDRIRRTLGMIKQASLQESQYQQKAILKRLASVYIEFETTGIHIPETAWLVCDGMSKLSDADRVEPEETDEVDGEESEGEDLEKEDLEKEELEKEDLEKDETAPPSDTTIENLSCETDFKSFRERAQFFLQQVVASLTSPEAWKQALTYAGTWTLKQTLIVVLSSIVFSANFSLLHRVIVPSFIFCGFNEPLTVGVEGYLGSFLICCWLIICWVRPLMLLMGLFGKLLGLLKKLIVWYYTAFLKPHNGKIVWLFTD